LNKKGEKSTEKRRGERKEDVFSSEKAFGERSLKRERKKPNANLKKGNWIFP